MFSELHVYLEKNVLYSMPKEHDGVICSYFILKKIYFFTKV